MKKLIKSILKSFFRSKFVNLIRAIILHYQLRKINRKANFRHFKREVRNARKLAKLTGKRYRVYLFDEYRALSREDIQRMKNRNVIDKKQQTGMLSDMVLYDTLTDSNTHPKFSNRIV